MSRPDRLAKQLVSASLELHRRRTWTKVPPDAPFLIRVPTEEELVGACLIGQDGGELGLILVKGPDALGSMCRVFLENSAPDPVVDGCDSLGVTFERLGTIPDEFRRVLEAAGFQTRRENIAPLLSARPPFRHLRRVNRGEMRTLAWCLAGIFATEDRGELRPAAYESRDRARKILEIDVKGKLGAPEVTARFVTPPARDVVIGAAPVLLPADLGRLEQFDEGWIVGLAPIPNRIAGDPRTYCAVLIIDEESEQALCANVVPGGEMSAAVSALVEVLRENGLPRELTFTSEALMDVAAPGLAAIGVSSTLDLEEPLWWSVASKMTEAMDTGLDIDDIGETDPRTLEDWKVAELNFTRTFVRDLMERELLTLRAAKRYFGSEESATIVQEELEDLGVFPAFIEWFVADYRATKRSRTLVEKQLERKKLDPVERTFLEARRDAYLSFFRVISCEPGASLEVEDLLSDRRFTLQDRALSSSEIEGWYLPLRVFRIGEWDFPSVAGPPFNTFRIDRVLSQLEQMGMTLEPDVLRAEAHLIGHTWIWFFEAQASPPEFQNTDGDPLEMQDAEFEVADPGLFVSAIEGRDDVIIDEPGAEWTWVRAGGPAGVGDTMSLCHLQLFGDALIAGVNSARRMDAAREWVEALPGVRFKSMRRSEVDGADERALDDRLPGPAPEPLAPELFQELKRIMVAQALRWLDEPVPALRGLTPRAACATEEGRRQVARMIRTMPPMGIPGGEIPAPRERMLKELGL